MDRGDQHADIGRDLAPDALDPLHEVAALALIHEVDEVDTQLHGERLDPQQGLDRSLVVGRTAVLCEVGSLGPVQFGLVLLVGLVGRGTRERRHDEEGQVDLNAHTGEDQGGREQRQSPVRREELLSELASEALLVVIDDARDQHARGSGDDEGWNLADQAIPDGEHRVDLGCVAKPEPLLEHTDDDAAQDVDDGDHDARDCVPADELAGTVHGPVEVGFARDFLSALSSLDLVDEAGVQLCVDGHLLAWHRVEGEPRGDLGDTTSTLRDDHEVDDDQDDEDHETDDVAASHHDLAEGLDDLAGRGLRAAAEQDEPGARDVETQPVQRRGEQQRREDGELDRRLDVERRQEDEQARRDADGQQQVEDRCRHRTIMITGTHPAPSPERRRPGRAAVEGGCSGLGAEVAITVCRRSGSGWTIARGGPSRPRTCWSRALAPKEAAVSYRSVRPTDRSVSVSRSPCAVPFP